MTRTLLGLLMAALLVPMAHADDSIVRANNSVQVYTAVHNIDYVEVDHASKLPDGKLDSEKGTQAAVGVGLRFQGAPGTALAPLYVEANLQRADGNTTYDGYLQSQTSTTLTPYTYDNVRARTYDVSGKLGYAISIGNGIQQLTPYVAFGTHRWTRDSSDSPYGYREDYRHRYVAAGLKWQMVMGQNFIGELDGSVGHTRSASMATDDVVFPLQSKTVAGLQGALVQRLTDSIDLRYGVGITHFEYGKSPVIGDYLEPDSRTTNVTASLGLGVRF